MKLKLLPYKIASESARDVARALQVKRIRPTGNYKPGNKILVLNWGNSRPNFSTHNWINKPGAIQQASNKLKAFQQFKSSEISTPDFTTDKQVAQQWLNARHKVVCRHKLSGTNGDGIQIIKPGETIPNSPLYVKYQKKDKEFRVHVFNGKVIDVTEKRKRSNFIGERNQYVRNLLGGWVFCRDNVNPTDVIRQESIKAVACLGLDFGAVDVIEREGKAYILEVNTSPGLQNSTLHKYIEAILEFIEDSRE